MAYLMSWQRRKPVSVAGNQEYTETDSVNSVYLSLKSHPLWVTLYHSHLDMATSFLNSIY